MSAGLWDAVHGLPEGLAASRHLYLLGVGGPEDESGIGHPDRFVWRFTTLEATGADPILLGFGDMPTLMRFTRTVNQRQPFSLPTESLKLPAGDLAGVAVQVLIDPSPAEFERLRAEREIGQQRIVELGG